MSNESESGNRRINISLRPSIIEKAYALMKARDFGELSGFLAQLIREEHERRQGPAVLAETPVAPAVVVVPTEPKAPIVVKYPRPKKGSAVAMGKLRKPKTLPGHAN